MKEETKVAKKQIPTDEAPARGRQIGRDHDHHDPRSRLFLVASPNEESDYARAFRIASEQGYTAMVAELIENSHRAGDPRAIYSLGTWYLFGEYHTKDVKRGNKLMRLAAQRGVAEAWFNLGVSYETGSSLKENKILAFECYSKAFFLGDETAIDEIIRCIYYGIGTERSKTIANIIRQLVA